MILQRLAKLALSDSLARLDHISASLIVTWLAEMGCAPAEPARDRTAKFAFVVNKLSAVSVTLSYTSSQLKSSTARAN